MQKIYALCKIENRAYGTGFLRCYFINHKVNKKILDTYKVKV